MMLQKGGLLELYRTVPIPNLSLRWGANPVALPVLGPGRYIVLKASPVEVLLADGDWNAKGEITYQSAKHTTQIMGSANVWALENVVTGPKEWRPRRRT